MGKHNAELLGVRRQLSYWASYGPIDGETSLAIEAAEVIEQQEKESHGGGNIFLDTSRILIIPAWVTFVRVSDC